MGWKALAIETIREREIQGGREESKYAMKYVSCGTTWTHIILGNLTPWRWGTEKGTEKLFEERTETLLDLES